jgi:hypothetical protein
MKDKDFKVFLETFKNKLEEDSQESKSKENKLRKSNLLETIFFILFFPIMYIVYFYYIDEDKVSFPGIMASLAASLALLSVTYSLVFRMYIGKIERNGDFSYFYFPLFIYIAVFGTLCDFIIPSIHDYNDYAFLIIYRNVSSTLFLLIISFFITRKIYWFVFLKKNSDLDSNKKNNP